MKKPASVRVVEGLGWIYVLLSALLCLGIVWDGGFWPAGGLALSLLLAVLGMVLALRRGRRLWFLTPNVCVWGFFLCGAHACGNWLLGAVAGGFAAGPLLLLNLPSARRWAKERTGNVGLGEVGYAAAFFGFVLLLVGLAVLAVDWLDEMKATRARAFSASMRGRRLLRCMNQEAGARMRGEAWVDASSFPNSLEYLQALKGKYGEEVNLSDGWCVAVNPPDDVDFPLLVSPNIDPRGLFRPEEKKAKMTCPADRGGVCLGFCENWAVIIRKDGTAAVLEKDVPCGYPEPLPGTYFLTPAGRVGLAQDTPAPARAFSLPGRLPLRGNNGIIVPRL